MDEWPDYITKAFQDFYYVGTEEEMIEVFASRWGGLDLETFERVLERGQGRDRAIAIFALGYSDMPEVPTLLLPFLSSPYRQERWASAVCLEQMQEEQAFPVLKHILLEEVFDLPSTSEMHLDEEIRWYEGQRGRVALQLAQWNDHSMVPLLRQALRASWLREHEWKSRFMYRHSGPYSEDAIAFALGKLGAFGALSHLDVPQARLHLALIHLVLGYLYTRGYRYKHIIMELGKKTALGREVARVLKERFGYSEAEAEESIEQFLTDYLARPRE